MGICRGDTERGRAPGHIEWSHCGVLVPGARVSGSTLSPRTEREACVRAHIEQVAGRRLLIPKIDRGLGNDESGPRRVDLEHCRAAFNADIDLSSCQDTASG